MWWAPSMDSLLTPLLVVLLLVLWGAVFVPSILRAREKTSPIVSVGMFRRRMRVLSGRPPASGRWVLMPATPQELEAPRRRSIRRRRQIFTGLVFLAVATLLLGLLPGLRVFLRVHLTTDVLLATYVAFLIWVKERSDRHLPKHAARPDEADDDSYLRAGQL